MGKECRDIVELKEKLGIYVDDKLLLQAVTHTSYAHEQKDVVDHNERLEFLGDAVLELAISETLYKKYPELPEGELTKLRAELVCELSLVKIAEKLDLGKYLRLGKGEDSTGGRDRRSTLADTVEALIGAVYLQTNYDQTKQLILDLFKDQLSHIDNQRIGDYKTMIQELVQDRYGDPPKYQIVKESGPDHDKSFVAEVQINNEVVGRGSGKSKKEAEQNAAHFAFQKLSK
ncbi:ribonuclease III [Natranaerobius thermophilus]|uniref:Ribonuclease 3 n=1 Tax=Natranaerobius thermophilus (strain ATCC BAA-1301 / DSM 18059 / JW/NM-WN-LF) TaxID=457570 RepID=RNC_NATTJ|nr:ribonuclease III [Natranaerobius thermophilus]B2A2N1.1 RecName: Full=Ribonuclease 3; AltName: Full=Ribonuclease III; Short=RNase III [Natranaerobius thermophilus JW/NM-WN-LF]ACB84946.1 Ribonuclease III [Natranaerobius thermophilus JW/NM-WN-LF]